MSAISSANDSSSSSTSLRCCSSSDSFTMALLVFLPSYFHIRHARKQSQQQISGRKLDGFLNSLRFQERAFTKFLKRLLKLLLRVHYDWPIPRNRLHERLTRHQKEPDTIVTGLHDNFITTVKEHE